MATMSGNVTLDPIQVGTSPLDKDYFRAAKALFPGLEVLAHAEVSQDDAFILVAGFAAETLIKCQIARNKKATKSVLRHELAELWADAWPAAGDPPPPQWLVDLAVFHGRPYVIRYKEGTQIYSLPSRANTLIGLRELRDLVGETGTS